MKATWKYQLWETRSRNTNKTIQGFDSKRSEPIELGGDEHEQARRMSHYKARWLNYLSYTLSARCYGTKFKCFNARTVSRLPSLLELILLGYVLRGETVHKGSQLLPLEPICNPSISLGFRVCFQRSNPTNERLIDSLAKFTRLERGNTLYRAIIWKNREKVVWLYWNIVSSIVCIIFVMKIRKKRKMKILWKTIVSSSLSRLYRIKN